MQAAETVLFPKLVIATESLPPKPMVKVSPFLTVTCVTLVTFYPFKVTEPLGVPDNTSESSVVVILHVAVTPKKIGFLIDLATLGSNVKFSSIFTDFS